MRGPKTPDVLVLGEVLVELTAPVPLREAETLRLACSGDALNAAAAAAAAGASVALVTAVGDDELGDRILEFVAARGIDTTLIARAPEPNGVYFAGADGEFVYVRRGSAASTLGPDDVARAPRRARRVLVSGITQALSDSCAAAVDAAVAAAGGHVVYDPNFRRRLTSVGGRAARAAARRAARRARHAVVPGRHRSAARHDRSRRRGGGRARRSAPTRSRSPRAPGLHLDAGDGPSTLPPTPARVVDTTGAGDVLAGTAAARLALGDDLLAALRRGMIAAARSLAGPGGTGWLPA